MPSAKHSTRHAWLLRRSDGSTERHPVSGYHELEGGEAMLAAAVAGQGVAQLPTWLAGEQLAAGTLIPVLEGRRSAQK
nr:LysR substrate-binding domain-containing protein [Paraburkholderia ultramafica]